MWTRLQFLRLVMLCASSYNSPAFGGCEEYHSPLCLMHAGEATSGLPHIHLISRNFRCPSGSSDAYLNTAAQNNASVFETTHPSMRWNNRLETPPGPRCRSCLSSVHFARATLKLSTCAAANNSTDVFVDMTN